MSSTHFFLCLTFVMKENLVLCKTSADGNKVTVVKSPVLSQMNPVLSGSSVKIKSSKTPEVLGRSEEGHLCG